jgi:hypothetical protein
MTAGYEANWSPIDDARALVVVGNTHICAAARNINTLRRLVAATPGIAEEREQLLVESLGVYRQAYREAYGLEPVAPTNDEDGAPIDASFDVTGVVADYERRQRDEEKMRYRFRALIVLAGWAVFVAWRWAVKS